MQDYMSNSPLNSNSLWLIVPEVKVYIRGDVCVTAFVSAVLCVPIDAQTHGSRGWCCAGTCSASQSCSLCTSDRSTCRTVSNCCLETARPSNMWSRLSGTWVVRRHCPKNFSASCSPPCTTFLMKWRISRTSLKRPCAADSG